MTLKRFSSIFEKLSQFSLLTDVNCFDIHFPHKQISIFPIFREDLLCFYRSYSLENCTEWSHAHTLFLTRIKLAVKSQGTRGDRRMNIETIENRQWLKRDILDFWNDHVAQNDHVVAVFSTRIKLAVKSQGTRQNKRMNIETIENG